MSESNLDIHQECKVSDDQRVAGLVLNESINVHKHDKYGWTLLAVAARYGKQLTATNLLEKRGVDANQTNKHDKSTPLFWAAREGDDDMVQLLLSHHGNPNKARKDGLTPVLVAARERQDIVVDLLLASKKVNVDQKDLHGRTALHYACESEPRSTAVLLIKDGASNLPDKDGITPFHQACRHKWEDIVDLLLERIVAKGDTQLLHTKDHFDRLPIHYMVAMQFDQDKKRWRKPQHASKFCLLSALFDLEKRNLKLLGQYPAKASFLVEDPSGHLPSSQAVRFGSDHMVEMLTLTDETNQFSIKPSKSGYLPIHRALTISYRISKRVAIAELLLKAKQGFDSQKYHKRIIESVRTPDPNGYYPLHLALKYSPSRKIIKLLLEADAHETGISTILKKPGPDGMIPLHIALIESDDVDDEVIKMLIDYDTGGETVLIREPKSRKVALHYAFENNLPSQDQLKVLIDGDWEDKSVYMRDGDGCISLHRLLKNQTKEDNPEDVADLAQILLFDSAKQRDILVPQDQYSPLVMIVDRETGMMPLHMAFKHGAPNEVIELLMQFENPEERNSGPSVIVDKAGKVPIHHACENPSTDPGIIFRLLEHSEDDVLSAMDKQKNLPFFLALRLEKADRQLLNALLPRSASHQLESLKPKKRATAILDRIYQPMLDINLKEILEEKIEAKTAFRGIANMEAFEWLHRLCRRYDIEDYKLNEAVVATLDSKTTIDWLNAKSSDRWSVFVLMSDCYAHISWIIVFDYASKAYLSELHPNSLHEDNSSRILGWVKETLFESYPNLNGDDGNHEYDDYKILGWVLLGFSLYFFIFRECVEAIGNDTFLTYLKDPWNWFENATNVCVAISSYHFVAFEEPKHIEYLLVTSGLMQFAFAVSFLRNTFLPYAQFVGGILNIFKELIPFLVVTALILMAFAYAAFVENYELDVEGFDDFLASFKTLFGDFVGGPGAPKTATDFLFGVISVVILLNVVIAIVSNVWDDSTEKTTVRFWRYRIAFIQEVAYTKEFLTAPIYRWCGARRIEATKQHELEKPGWESVSARPKIEKQPRSLSIRRLHHHMTCPQDAEKPELNAWEKLVFFVTYLILLVLGLVSFGQAWPAVIRKNIFGSNKGIVAQTKADKKIDSSKLDGIHRSVQKLSDADMEERMKKVETEMLKMQDTMGDVHDLLKKLAVHQLPEAQDD